MKNGGFLVKRLSRRVRCPEGRLTYAASVNGARERRACEAATKKHDDVKTNHQNTLPTPSPTSHP